MDLTKVSSKLELLRLIKGNPLPFVESVWALIQKERKVEKDVTSLADENDALASSVASLEQIIAEMRGML